MGGPGTAAAAELPVVARAVDDVNRDLIVVKFAEGTGIRLRDGELRPTAAASGPAAQNRAAFQGLQAVSSIDTIEHDLETLAALLRAHPGAHVERRIRLPEETVDAIRLRARGAGSIDLADMNLYFEVHLPFLDDADRERARLGELLAAFNRLEIVQVAFAEPIMEVATLGPAERASAEALLAMQRTTTPDFSDQQGYLYDAPVGVEADEAWNFAGGRGAGVKIVDIEFGWRFTHEDLKDPFFVDGDPGTDDHGTAVLGEFSGVDNGYGVTGIASDVEIGGASVNGMSLAEAILLLITVLDPGDIYVIELHGTGPFGNWVPMEFWQDNFDAIQTASALGIIGCEAAGNGSEDLDFPGYNGVFDRRVRDSGAIMCGAGTPYDLEGEWFTNYGSRVDLEGWGSSVVTTCCGDLWDNGPDSTYTAGFNGTSSATPIVTGAVASLQGQSLALFGEPLTPWLAAEILSRTGSPWNGPKEIGERPNLLAARDLIVLGFATIDVTVRDAETLLALEGVVVEILETGRLAIADAEGHITFQMSAGDFTLHSEGTFFYGATDLPVTVVAGEHQELFLDLTLLPTGAVTGIVFDGDLDRVSGATIECLFSPLDPAVSDPDGGYLIDAIPEGSAYQFLVGGIPGLGCAYHAWDIVGNETVRWYPVLIDAEDFEATDGGFAGQGDWEWGTPGGPGPGGTFSGENCWATKLYGYYHTYQWISLTSPVYDFSAAEVLFLSFHHWYWIHEYDDGGNVQVFYDGSWHIVEPVEGYDADQIPTLGPGFTGGSDDWEGEIFDLSDYASDETQIRFRFVSDNLSTGPGWYIDDVTLDTEGGAQTVDLFPEDPTDGGSPAARTRLVLRQPLPNPCATSTRIAFRLPGQTEISLTVLDIQGRRVGDLYEGVLPAGEHVVGWDGMDDRGAAAPAGLYFVRLCTQDGRSETRPLIRVR
jgi:hypothetical protein